MSRELDDSQRADAETRLGHLLRDRWQLDELLGVGGMAAVYAATHRNGKRVAVKVLHRELSTNTLVRERFLREGYVANSVSHPGAVSVDDDDVADDGCAFLVMELLEGETLEARWERKGRHLPVEEVLALMDQVLDTLIAAHAAGVVHRDLKPENLFLTRAGHVKVLDFGIARVRQTSASTSTTQTGSMMGTPAFMPPEQARGRWDDVDARTDLWAIGATMFTLLTGEHVHVAETVNEALALAVTSRARPVATVRPDIPREIAELIDQALSYERELRFADAAAMQHALRVAYAGWQERKALGTETTLVSAQSPVLATTAPPMPSATLADIPSSSGTSTPRGPALTTSRGLGSTFLATAARVRLTSPAVVVGVVGAALITALYFALRSPAEPETVPSALFPSAVQPPVTASSSKPVPSQIGEVVPVLGIDDLPIAPAPSSASPTPPRPRLQASAPASTPAPGAPRSPQPAGKSFDPYAARE
jgi:eukaryotic-like serine/threonine-protein kinase